MCLGTRDQERETRYAKELNKKEALRVLKFQEIE